MTNSSSQSNPANQDDPWEQLAEDLFGLEYGKEHAIGQPPAPSADIVAPSPAQSEAPEEPPEADSGHSRPIENPPRFAAEAAVDSPGSFDEQLEAAEAAAIVPENPAQATPRSAQDSYWDALANWNWDESEGGKSRSEQPRAAGGPPPHRSASRGREEGHGRRGGDRPPQHTSEPSRRPAPAASPEPKAPQPSSPSAGDDFGSGIGDSDSGLGSPPESPVAREKPSIAESQEMKSPPVGAGRTRPEATPQGREGRGGDRGERRPASRPSESRTEADASQKRRRRRRRRRSRGGEGAPAGSAMPAPDFPDADWSDEGPEEESSETADRPAVEGDVGETGDEFGVVEPSTTSRDAEFRRGGESQRRGMSSDRSDVGFDDEEELEQSDEAVASEGISDDSDSDFDAEADDESDDESGDQSFSYDNVPTWEEAISYLLHPGQVQVDSPSGFSPSPPRGAPPADQPRQTRHIGHRKHRR